MSYLPASQSGYAIWGANFDAIVTASPATYGVTAPQMVTWANAFTVFTGAKAISDNPSTRTPVTVQDTLTAFQLSRAATSFIVGVIQASNLPSDADLTSAGLTIRKTTKTPIAAPTATPDLSVERITPQSMIIRLKELGALGNALPAGAVGYEVAMKVNPTVPPASPSELEIVGTGSRRFYTLSFPPANIGSPVFVAMRYRNATNQLGPWSSIVSSTVVSG
jgi:hypothetical protein